MKRRGGETVKGSNGVRECRSKGVKENYTDTPIRRYTDTAIHRFPDSKKAGFTVLEAMVALVILSLALLALLRVLPVGIKGSKLAEETTIATMLAQRKTEETRAAGYPALGNPDGTFGSPDNNFDWEIKVIVGPTDTVREVSCSIYWPADSGSKGDRGKQRCVGIKTYIANY